MEVQAPAAGKTEATRRLGVFLRDVIHPLTDPIYAEGATAVLKGNLAPRGCVMKPAAADRRFLAHRGRALAFDDYNHMAREVERDDLEVTPDHVLVLKNAGPKGGPGMPGPPLGPAFLSTRTWSGVTSRSSRSTSRAM